MIFASLWQRLFLWINRWWLRLRRNAPADSTHGGPPAHWLADVARVNQDGALITQAPSPQNIPTPLRHYTRQPQSYAHRQSRMTPPAHWLAHATRIRRGEPAVAREHITASPINFTPVIADRTAQQNSISENENQQTPPKIGQWKLPQKKTASQLQLESTRTRRIVRVRLRQPRLAKTKEIPGVRNNFPPEHSSDIVNKNRHMTPNAHFKNEHVISDYVQKVPTTSIIRIPRPAKLHQQHNVISDADSHNHDSEVTTSRPKHVQNNALNSAQNSAPNQTAPITTPNTDDATYTGDDNALQNQDKAQTSVPLQNVNTETQPLFIAAPTLQNSRQINSSKTIRRTIRSWWEKIIPTWFVSDRPQSSGRQALTATHQSQPHVASNSFHTIERAPQLNANSEHQTDRHRSPDVVNSATAQPNSHVASSWPQLPELEEVGVSMTMQVATRHPLPEHAWNV